ncbi:hypothetical protein [Ancylobacter sp. G4_0304]|uniref:hypothetical protein n=1 Tax=Ancylobacter sp. G4_0304 TaxID=3114289 RepID=UPI0039C665F4
MVAREPGLAALGDRLEHGLAIVSRPPCPAALHPLRDRLAQHGLLLVFALFVVFFGVAGFMLGGDGTPDLRIYHRYNGFAAVTGGRPQDIAPAQLQSFFYPGLDALYFRLTDALNAWPRLLSVLMALPYAPAAFLIFLAGRLTLPDDWPRRDGLAAAGALFGITGAAAFSTLGTTMSEIVPGLPFLAGLALWLSGVARPGRAGSGGFARIAAAGLLCGVTVGLKLTTVPLFVGLFLAVFLSELPRGRRAIAAAVVFGACGVLATLVVAGPFWWSNYQLTGNPVFPAYNDIFRSDWVGPGRWTDERFKPQDWPSILLYPASWAFRLSNRAIEIHMRDPRMLMLLAAVALIALKFVVAGREAWREPSTRRAGLVAVFLFVAFVLWQVQFSIYRYLSLIESYSGIVIVAAALMWGERRYAFIVGWLLICLGAYAVKATSYPWWSRSLPAPHAYEASLPAVPDGALVVFLDTSALSHVIPGLPPGVRVITSNSNLVRPGDPGTLSRRIDATIRDFQGPIWGFENTRDFPGVADATLAYHHLRRTSDCAPIRTNVDEAPHRGCRLERVAEPASTP